MKLVKNAGTIAKKAHSMWAQYLAAGFLVTPEALFFLLELDTNPRVWWFLALTTVVYGIVGRIVDQGVSDA